MPLASFIFFLSVTISPFYILPSGNPQPSHLLFLLFSGIIFLGITLKKYAISLPKYFMLLLLLAAWITTTATTWALIDNDASLAFPSLYYFYNFIVAVAIFLYLRRQPNKEKILTSSFSVALLILFMGVTIDIYSGSRATGFFNNPNQLGYFSIISLSIIAVASNFKINSPIQISGFSAGIITSLASASLASWGGLTFIAAAFTFKHIKTINGFFKFASWGGIMLITITFFVLQNEQIKESVKMRFERAPEKISALYEERNYDRVFAFPEYWILGAGKADNSYQRFQDYAGAEVHSSFGNLLLSYGLGPFLIFIYILGILFSRAPLPVWFVLGGVLAYSLVHMGLRFTPFWILLVVIYTFYIDNKTKKTPEHSLSKPRP